MSNQTAQRANPFSTWLAAAVAVTLVVAGGALYGSYSQRWGPPQDLLGAANIVSQVPERIGEWTVIDEAPIGQSALTMLECAGYINRKYQHNETGKIVNLAILVGPPGPIAVHTPEVCFSSRAYDQETDRKEVEIVSDSGSPNSFWSLDFVTKNVLADRLRVYYAWSPGSIWVASQSPRYAYAALPGLFKLQLAAEVPPGDDTDDPGRDFLKALIDSDWVPLTRQTPSPGNG